MCIGQSNDVDGKKWDVFSLGIVFAYVFTGKEVLHRHQPYPANSSRTRNFALLIMCPDYQSAATPSFCITPLTGIPRLD